MKYLFPLIFLFVLCEGRPRVATSDAEVKPAGTSDAKVRPPLTFPCMFRTLQGGDAYPSVVVRWHGQIQRVTWNSNGEVTYDQNYVHPTQSHSYPSSSSGLSGDSGSSNSDPFGDAFIVPDDYVFDDIVASFTQNCKRPY